MSSVVDDEAKSIILQKMQLKALGQEDRIVGTFASYHQVI